MQPHNFFSTDATPSHSSRKKLILNPKKPPASTQEVSESEVPVHVPLRRPRPFRFERLRVPVWNPYSRGRLGPAKSEDPKGGEGKVDANLTNFLSTDAAGRSEEHTSELQSLAYLVCRLLLEKKKQKNTSSRQHTYLHYR